MTFTGYHSIAANRSHTADIRHSIQIAAKPEAIYPLVATGERFKQWWAADVIETSGAERLGFRLEARGAATQLHFTHSGWQSETDYFINCTTTWGELMYRLKAAAEGKPKGPLFLPGDLAY